MQLIIKGLFSILISLILVTLILSLYVVHQAWQYPPRAHEVPVPTILSDPTRGFVQKPGLNLSYPFGVNQSFIWITDARGARVMTPRKSPEQITVLTAGDSQTCGLGINYQDTFSSQLESMIKKPVLNIGVSGYGTVSIMRQIEKFMSLKPKIVILGYYYDHAVRSTSACYPGFMLNCLSVPFIKLDKNNNPYIVEANDNQSALDTMHRYYNYIAGRSGKYSFLKDFYWSARQLWAHKMQRSKFFFGRSTLKPDQRVIVDEFLLRKINNMVKKEGARLIVLYIPDYFGPQVITSPPHLFEISKNLGFTFIDMTSDFADALANEHKSIMIPNDGHLNALGHQLIAKRLTENIRIIP